MFVHEVARYDLRFTCTDCVYHRPKRDRCAHDWPDAEHRTAPMVPPGGRAEVSFCKEFELA